ncbi:MAG: type II toxin-antitoxin system HicA family toxin [Bryobacterales bacterium]|nr:type II toxin-antitoxin system HicA family toxin [Bryobacterales bacterium]
MSTLPRPTGKELVRALERAGFNTERTRGSHCFLRHSDGRATVVPMRGRTLGLGLLRKILSDCSIEPEQLQNLL